jgi:hypothetical protein
MKQKIKKLVEGFFRDLKEGMIFDESVLWDVIGDKLKIDPPGTALTRWGKPALKARNLCYVQIGEYEYQLKRRRCSTR